jgi:hypothetical protein
VEEIKVPPVLDVAYKKQLHAKYTLGIEDDYCNISKTGKGRYIYDLKDGIAKTLKPIKRKNGLIIEDKVSQDYIVDKIIDIEKRIAFYENKQHKNKKKINRIIEDIYEDDNSNNKSNDIDRPDNKIDKTNNNIEDIKSKDKTNNNIEDKLKDIVENDNTTTSIQSQQSDEILYQRPKFKSNQRIKFNN